MTIPVIQRRLDVHEMAGRLRTTTSAMYIRRHRGQGPHGVMFSGRLSWRESDVEAWLAEAFAAAAIGPTDNPEWVPGVRLMTDPEVAQAFGCSQTTLKTRRREGTAPRSVVIAGRRLYREDDVAAWLDAALGPHHPGAVRA